MVKSWSWHKVVLIPKGYGKDFRGIGLVEFLWKAATGIINLRMTTDITYHVSFHGFQAGCGTLTAILKAKLIHQLTSIREVVIHTIFLDL